MNLIVKKIKNPLFFAFALLFIWSCGKDDSEEVDVFEEEQRIEASEINLILNTDSFSSTVDAYLINAFQTNQTGKSSTQNSNCTIADITDNGYTITFDNCTVDGSDEVLNGTLSVVFEEGNEDAAFTATYNGVSVGDIVLNGTRSFVLSDDEETVIFNIESDMTITMADGSVLAEIGSRNFTLSFTTTQILDFAFAIEGDWTVTNNDEVYEISITTPLRSSFSCDFISSGVIALVKDGFETIVDFGNGDCDGTATITHPDGSITEFNLTD